MKQGVANAVQAAYDKQYEDASPEWRELGGINKARNIVEVSSTYQFSTALDVGAGDGAVLKWLAAAQFVPEFHALEISDSGLEKIVARQLSSVKRVSKFDGYTIPYSDKAFEVATCSHVMEHVEHPRLLLREIGRVAEYQIFEVPIDFSFSVDKKVKHFLSYGHINIFTPALFRFLLLSEGFEILHEKHVFFDKQVLNMLYPHPVKRMYMHMKNYIIKTIPAFRHYKPNAYTVLCKYKGNSLTIM